MSKCGKPLAPVGSVNLVDGTFRCPKCKKFFKIEKGRWIDLSDRIKMRYILVHDPTVLFAFCFDDTKKSLKLMRLMEYFLSNCWHIVRAYVPELKNLDKRVVIVLVAPPRPYGRSVASYLEFKPQYEKDYLAIEIGDVTELVPPEYNELGWLWAIGNTLMHEIMHHFYQDDKIVETRLEKFRGHLRSGLMTMRPASYRK